MAEANFWPDQSQLMGVVQFDDVEIKHLFTSIIVAANGFALPGYQNPSLLKTM